MATASTTLKRHQIRKIFRENYGAAMSVARGLGIAPQTVSQWLAGRMTSSRIAEACERKALELSGSSATSKQEH